MSFFEATAKAHEMKCDITLVQSETRTPLRVITVHMWSLRKYLYFRHVHNSSNLQCSGNTTGKEPLPPLLLALARTNCSSFICEDWIA